MILQAQRGGRPGQAGTWGHPKLAVFFARWLDVKFGIWCDAMIEDSLKGAAKVDIVKPQQLAIQKDGAYVMGEAGRICGLSALVIA